jgi:hypothetical protein
MDLHAAVSGAIGAVNPFVSAQYVKSTGTVTNPDGSRTPSYAAPVDVSIQMQELSFKELQQVQNLNLQGIVRSMYMEGAAYGVYRGAGTGGDKIVYQGQTWLVVAVAEQWPNWVKVLVQLQVNA